MNGATARFSDFRCAVAGLHVGGVRASDQRHQVERIAHTPTHRHTRKLGTQQINRIIVIRKKTLFPKKIFRLARRVCVIASSIIQLGRLICMANELPVRALCVSAHSDVSISRTASAYFKYLSLSTWDNCC